MLIIEGSGHNNFFLYEEAIKLLNEAIKRDPTEKEAFKERAFSFFELGNIDQALEDYHHVKKNKPPYNLYKFGCVLSNYSSFLGDTSSSLDFAKGLLYGSMIGGREGTIEYVSSIRGSLNFLWSFACSPIDVSRELIEALREIGELLASGRVSLLLQEALPELYECGEYWNTWSEYTKGQKLGFIIGKYSISAFFAVTSFKWGGYYYNKLKRENLMTILDRYVVTKNAAILEESARHAQKNTAILKKAANGSIVAHNTNVLPHIFKKKHRWDKFIDLTGIYEKDFEKLVLFLEEQKILCCERKLIGSFKGVNSYKYTKRIGADTIVAIFDVNAENIPLLKNAWVGTVFKANEKL